MLSGAWEQELEIVDRVEREEAERRRLALENRPRGLRPPPEFF